MRKCRARLVAMVAQAHKRFHKIGSVCILFTTAPDFADCTFERQLHDHPLRVFRQCQPRASGGPTIFFDAAESSASGPVSRIASAERGPTTGNGNEHLKNSSSSAVMNPKRSSASSRTWRWQKNLLRTRSRSVSSVPLLAKSFSPARRFLPRRNLLL